MSYSYVQYTGNGATTNFAFSFPYLDSSHIKVRVNGVTTAFTFVNSGTVQISPAPLTGTIIDIRRETPKDLAPVNFTDGSVLLEQDLDLLASFNLYTAQESADGVADSITKDTTGVWDAQSRRIKSLADPVNANDAVNKTWAETGMTSQLASATSQATISTTKASEAAASASSASTSASTATTKASEASASATSAGNSATSATASAATATTKASEALASQVAAAASASTASTKASEANTSAGNAASSATTAGTQAGIATTKATEASASASAAATSAATATTKADSATASATSATAGAATATTKASEASASASSASTSASNAATSASTATTQATNAASSATSAATSASDANTSAVSAASSAASAAALLDNFDDRYLGAKSSAPSLDNDGNALVLGALYFDSTTGKMRVYTASGWIDASSASVATLATFEFVATAGQTVFTGNDANGASLAYVAPALMVTLNGVRLRPGDDYTATNGTSITLVNAAALNDELVVDAFGSFLVANTYTIAETNSLLSGKQASLGYTPVNKAGDTITSGGRLQFQNSDGYSMYGIRATRYGYSSTYRSLQIGNGTGDENIALGVDVSTINGGSFSGNGKDIVVPNGVNFSMPNSANNDLITPMRFDSAGRVIMPNQPMFTVYNPTQSSSTTAGVFPFTNAALNVGSHFNTSTYKFTAPVTGNYKFTLSNLLKSGAHMTIRKNGGYVINAGGTSGIHQTGTTYIVCCKEVIIPLVAGDYVSAYQENTNEAYYDWAIFTGQLVG